MRTLAASLLLAVLSGTAFTQTPGDTGSEPAPQAQERTQTPPQPRRSRVPYPPISVAPPVIDVPRSITTPAPVTLPSPAPRAAAITTCDAGGCWDSDGRRLNSVGPLLLGPGGACTAQSGVVHCP